MHYWCIQPSAMEPERDISFRFISPVLILFQIAGLCPVDIKSKRKSKSNHLIWLYSFGIALASAINGYFFIRNQVRTTDVYVNVAIDQAMWLSAFVAHAIICFEVFATIPRHVQIFQRVQNVLQVFNKRLTNGINLGLLRQKYVIGNWTSFLAIVFGVALSLMVIDENALKDCKWVILSGTCIMLRLLQVTTYVNFVKELLDQLRLELVRIGTDSGTIKRCSALDECMQIYSMINDIVKLLNSVFGWSLIAILTQNVSSMTNTSYWTVYNLYYMQRSRLNICKCLCVCNKNFKS